MLADSSWGQLKPMIGCMHMGHGVHNLGSILLARSRRHSICGPPKFDEFSTGFVLPQIPEDWFQDLAILKDSRRISAAG